MASTKDALLDEMEKAILSILRDNDATRSERLQAIVAGGKLALIKHKVSGDEDEGSFFSHGRK